MTNENKTQQELEDEFFGEPDALKMREDDGTSTQKLQTLRTNTGEEIKEAADTNTAEHLIDRLQEEGKLPESLYAPQLARFLEFLGKKMGIKINIRGEGILFPDNQRELTLTIPNLVLFLKRGALAATFLMPLVISSNALAQELQPGMDLVEEGVTKVVNEGHYMLLWENLTALLLLLGIGSFVVAKLLKKYKKTDTEKVAFSGFKKYQKAKKEDDKAAEEEAKKEMLSGTMSELPSEIDEAAGKIEIADKDEIKKIFEIKKIVDQAINNATLALETAMILPEEKSVKILDGVKENVLKIFEQELAKLESLYEDLGEKWTKAAGDSYLRQQLEYEKKKLKYIMDYLKLMRKKWLVVIQMAKNESILKTDNKDLTAEEQLEKAVYGLKSNLSKVLDNQSTLDSATFQEEIKKLDDQISQKTGGAGEEEKEVGFDKIVLHNGGNYNHTTGVNYTINGQDFHHDLQENFTVQIWINESNKIQMNFNHKGVLVEFQPLIVATQNGFAIKETSQLLEDYLKEKQEDKDIKAIAATADLPPEAAPVITAMAQAVIDVKAQIQNGSYQTFGKKVEADDEAIKYHLFRMHREYFQGKPNTVVRFTLEEGYWKKALVELDSQNDIPKSTVYFNYENSKGEKMSINQPMRRFNVLVGGKQASVLITADEKYKAMAGEVRIIFSQKDEYTNEELQQVFAEVSKRLGLNAHIKPVTPEAKEKLRKKLQQIRKDNADPSGQAISVHGEYDAETATPSSLEELQKLGLHSMYHQFDLDVLDQMFQAEKLLCTTTRWSKGVLKSGMSSTQDLGNGGATEVFMRCHTKNSVQNWTGTSNKPAVIFGPKLLTRLDCYCYASDKYGSKMPGVFEQRIGPSQLIKQLVTAYTAGHEVMMHDAVDLGDAQYIVYDNPASVIERLTAIGITTIGGKPLKEAVITREQFKKVKLAA